MTSRSSSENQADKLTEYPTTPAAPYQLSAQPASRAVIVLDSRHHVRFADAAIGSVLGIEPSDLFGKHFSEAVRCTLKHRFSDPDAFEERSQWLLANPFETWDEAMDLATQERRVVHRYSAPLFDDKGVHAGRIEVYSDITRRRQMEEANAQLYNQVRAAYEELRSTQEQLLQSEKLRAIGEIAAGVAHDFNNTLGIILGNIQLLLRSASDEKTRTRLSAIEKAALGGAETIRRIREFTKIRGDEPMNTVNLGELVIGVVEVMRPSVEAAAQLRDSHVTFDLEVAAEVYASCIPQEVREVLTNIILNSVQAMPQGGQVQITAERTDGWACVTIRDNGTGMTEDVKKRIFEPFFTTRSVEGAGLGMSVAYGIVKRHGGRIEIESELGKGTTVRVSLPAAPGPVRLRSSESAVGGTARPARILVVDDEEMFASVFAEMLSEHGHAVCAARSGDEALDRFGQTEFDLVFTDLGMPGMSGWQIARTMKEMRPGTPVVLVTGLGARIDEETLARSKADMILSKPVDMSDLCSVLGRMLARDEVDQAGG